MTQPQYVDSLSGTHYPIGVPRWQSDAGNPLSITDLPGITRGDINSGLRSLWRYAEAFPIKIARPVSLGEGCTPLVELRFRAERVMFKLEWVSPTCSFKDRGASVMISTLREQGIRAILEDSSGNGGSAIAAYSSAAGMKATILVPASTQAQKIVQMRAYGADIVLIPGTREETAREAIRQAASVFYASHNWNPFFLQGTKTLAYELWEDLGYSVPDNIIIPTGSGSNVLGCDLGFCELRRSGEIVKLPRLFAVQPGHCAPIDVSFRAGLDEIAADVEIRPTIAEGTAISNPVRIREVLAAIRRSNGMTVAVSEIEIERAMADLARIGLYVEPSSASAAAAMTRLLEAGSIAGNERTVLVLTGTGIKATERWSKYV